MSYFVLGCRKCPGTLQVPMGSDAAFPCPRCGNAVRLGRAHKLEPAPVKPASVWARLKKSFSHCGHPDGYDVNPPAPENIRPSIPPKAPPGP